MVAAEYIGVQQELSFNNLASRLGLNEQELVEAMKEAQIAVLQKRIAVTKDSFFGDLDQEYFDPDKIRKIDSIIGIIDFIRHHNHSYQKVIISTVAELFPAFEKAGLFDKDALTKIGDGKNDISRFLKSIPIVTLFESDQGPYVTRLDSMELIYVVRNKHMDLILERLLIPLIINSTVFQSEEKVNTFYNNYSIDKILGLYFTIAKIDSRNIIWTLQDEVLENIDPLFEKGLIVHYYGMILFWSMQYLINFHEYAHVMCNHFFAEKDPILMEIEADNFAINALYFNSLKRLGIEEKDIDEEAVNDKLIFMVMSPLWLFLLFSVSNIESGMKISDTHPHPLLRLGNSRRTLDVLTKNAGPLNRKLTKIFSFIEAIVNEMLKEINETQLQKIYNEDHYKKTSLFIYNCETKTVDLYVSEN